MDNLNEKRSIEIAEEFIRKTKEKKRNEQLFCATHLKEIRDDFQNTGVITKEEWPIFLAVLLSFNQKEGR